MMATRSTFARDCWTHAYRHVMWLKNGLPTIRSNDKTPYFRMFGTNDDMSKVRIFGYRVFAHIPEAQCTKFEPRAAKGVHIEHDDASAACLIDSFSVPILPDGRGGPFPPAAQRGD